MVTLRNQPVNEINWRQMPRGQKLGERYDDAIRDKIDAAKQNKEIASSTMNLIMQFAIVLASIILFVSPLGIVYCYSSLPRD